MQYLFRVSFFVQILCDLVGLLLLSFPLKEYINSSDLSLSSSFCNYSENTKSLGEFNFNKLL